VVYNPFKDRFVAGDVDAIKAIAIFGHADLTRYERVDAESVVIFLQSLGLVTNQTPRRRGRLCRFKFTNESPQPMPMNLLSEQRSDWLGGCY
jgi:hypothetical protein